MMHMLRQSTGTVSYWVPANQGLGRPWSGRRFEDCGEGGTKQLILDYYDDHATGNMTTWHGPEELGERNIHRPGGEAKKEALQ